MRSDLEDIVRAIRRKNGAPYIICTTNAGLLTKRRYQSLREAGVDHFSISLDYPDERHDEYCRIPGLFQRIRDLVGEPDSGVIKPITLSCCVQRENFRDMLKFAKLSADWKVRVNFSTYTWLRTKNKELLLTKEDLSELREIVNRLMELKKRNRNFYPSSYSFRRMIRYFEDGYIPGCLAGERFFVVNPNGAVSPCGLIMKYYRDVAQMRAEFVPTNTCGYCNTTVRSECEKPVQLLLRDNLESM